MTTMQMPIDVAPPPSAVSFKKSRPNWAVPHQYLPAAAMVVLLAVFVLWIATYYTPAISHPDANGYFAQASLLVKSGHTWFKPQSNAQYIGMHWLLTSEATDVYISRYPPGLAVLLRLVYAGPRLQASAPGRSVLPLLPPLRA